MKKFIKLINTRYRKFKQQTLIDAQYPGESRRKKRPKYRSFRIYRHIKPKKFIALPSSWQVLKESFSLIYKHKKKFIIFIIVYGLLYSALVKGFSDSFGLGEVKDVFKNAGYSFTDIYSGFVLFCSLITSSNSINNDAATVYQGVLAIVGSLSIIWLVRKMSSRNNETITVKDSFYKGMSQLVPFVIVLTVLFLEFTPALVGFAVTNFLITDPVSFSIVEVFAISIFCLSLVFLSLYLFSGSVAAIYIVTLPSAEPIKSLVASHYLLLLHRWSVMRKLLSLFMYIFTLNAVLLIPFIIFIPTRFGYIAEYVFLIFSILNFIVFHNFLYTMYKKLL